MMRCTLACVLLIVLVLSSSLDGVEGKRASKKKSTGSEESEAVPSGKSASKKKDKSSKPVLGKIDAIASKGAWTYLTDSNFSRYIVDRPRDYHAVVMFTATAQQYQCSVCVKTKEVFTEAAELYSEQYDFRTADAGQGGEWKNTKKMAFFLLEVDGARRTFNDMGLETVPRTYVLPPTQKNTPKLRMQDYEVSSNSLMEGTKGFLSEVTRYSKIPIVVTVNPWPLLLTLGFVGYILAFIASQAASAPAEALLWYRSPVLWGFFSMCCYCVGVSGSIFCVIKSAPLYGRGYPGMPGGGEIQIFAPQGRDQFLIEGLIISAMCVGVGLLGYIMVSITKLKLGWGIGPFTIDSAIRHVVVLLSLATMIVFCLEIAESYKMKTGWYSVKDTFPKELWFFITSSVKKNSGLLKRLIRVSEIWIYEYKDWTTFQKKASGLTFEYLKKSLVAFLLPSSK